MSNTMLTVHRFKVEPEFTLTLDVDCQFLKVMPHKDGPSLYVLYNPDAPRTIFNFKAFGTGHTISVDQGFTYIDSFTITDPSVPELGIMYFHLFYQLALYSEVRPS